MKFKLEAIEGTSKVVVEFDEVLLYEVVQNLEIFLKATGFQLKNLDYDVPSS